MNEMHTLSGPVAKRFFGITARKVLFSLGCTWFASTLWHYAPIWNSVRYASAVVVRVGGDPLKGDGGLAGKTDEIEKKLPGHIPHLPHIPTPFAKSPEQIKAEAAAKEAERKAKEEAAQKEKEEKRQSHRNQLIARAGIVGLKIDPAWTIEQLEVEVKNAEAIDHDKKEKAPLIAECNTMGMAYSPEWDVKTFKEQIKEEKSFRAADLDYQGRYQAWLREMDKWKDFCSKHNARCPKCRYSMRISDQKKLRMVLCQRCTHQFSGFVGRAAWTPPPPPKEPQPPKRNPGLLQRAKRLFG